MSQISRPFQIALLAVAVLGAAWLFVFQPHPSSTATSSSSSAVVSAPPAGASSAADAAAKGAGSPSQIYHGSAPGVQGLTRAIAKAHEAVARTQQNAKTLERKSAQASGRPSTSATPTGASATKPTASAPAKSAPSSAKATSTPAPPAPQTRNTHSNIHAGQRSVEAELAHGNVVVVLFWNHNGADDEAVHRELQLLQAVHRKVQPYAGRPLVKRLLKAFGLELDKKIAVNYASASQIATFGAITRGIQVYGTPTMLVVDKHGKAIVLTGLQDAFSIEQAIDEARNVA